MSLFSKWIICSRKNLFNKQVQKTSIFLVYFNACNMCLVIFGINCVGPKITLYFYSTWVTDKRLCLRLFYKQIYSTLRINFI